MTTTRKFIREATDDFTNKGRAGGFKIRRNDPRFGDNPLAYPDEIDSIVAVKKPEKPEKLEEFDRSPSIERLHSILNDQAKVSDQEIKGGIALTDRGYQKIAAQLGTSSDDVQMLLSLLVQRVRDEEAANLEETYHRFLENDGRVSVEKGYLGDLTIRSGKKSKFLRGSEAAEVTRRLKGTSDAQQQAYLRSIVEAVEIDPNADYMSEIMADAGTYNFPWKYEGETGFGTAQFHTVNDKPVLRVISIRDMTGDEIDADPQMRLDLQGQAEQFMMDA